MMIGLLFRLAILKSLQHYEPMKIVPKSSFSCLISMRLSSFKDSSSENFTMSLMLKRFVMVFIEEWWELYFFSLVLLLCRKRPSLRTLMLNFLTSLTFGFSQASNARSRGVSGFLKNPILVLSTIFWLRRLLFSFYFLLFLYIAKKRHESVLFIIWSFFWF